MGRLLKQAPPPVANQSKIDSDALSKHIGQQLLEARRKLAWTQRRVAAESGLSCAYVCQLEGGKSVASVEVLMKLSKAMRVSLSYWTVGFGETQGQKA